MDQREVELAFTVQNGSLTITSPPNGNIAPPGYYMLFLLNSSGVPSLAKFVQVTSLCGLLADSYAVVPESTYRNRHDLQRECDTFWRV